MENTPSSMPKMWGSSIYGKLLIGLSRRIDSWKVNPGLAKVVPMNSSKQSWNNEGWSLLNLVISFANSRSDLYVDLTSLSCSFLYIVSLLGISLELSLQLHGCWQNQARCTG